MTCKTILKLASAGLVGATLIGNGTSAMAAPMGITPKATVETAPPVTDVQWRRWGGGWGYRRGWGGGWGWLRISGLWLRLPLLRKRLVSARRAPARSPSSFRGGDSREPIQRPLQDVGGRHPVHDFGALLSRGVLRDELASDRRGRKPLIPIAH